MELDSRILEGKSYLDCFDTEEAKQFIGKEGYFTDVLVAFTDISRYKTSVLTAIDEKAQSCFIDDTSRVTWNYFLPAEWVKEPEKKYRPYTLAEWVDQHEIGEVIHFRDKDYRQKFNVMYTGYVIDNGEEDIQDIHTTGRIMLMGTAYFLEDLFENYVICIDGEWQPFGMVKEK